MFVFLQKNIGGWTRFARVGTLEASVRVNDFETLRSEV